MDKPTLSQITTLSNILRDDINLQKHFNFTESGNELSDISLRQYRYIYYLLFKKKYFKLNNLLVQLKFKIKLNEY